jgi:hypothetical protein
MMEMLSSRLALFALAVIVAAPRPVAAEQCAPREIVWLSGPKGGVVPPSIRFRLYIGRGCSSIPEGPPAEVRLLSPRGGRVRLRRERWGGYTELVPARELQPGTHELQWRHAVDARHLGGWKELTRVRVSGRPDRTPPALTGPVRPSVKPVWGSNTVSPCEVEQGWELELTLRHPPALDRGTRHADLLYTLLRRTGSGKPELVRAYWPRRAGTLVRTTWREEYGWGKRWEYYVSVRDPSGNWTSLKKPVVIKTPPRPPRPRGAAPSKLDLR